MAFVELHNLAKNYGRVQALRDVSLRLEPGAIGLVGNNGAGKSTLLKVLLGLLKPDGGQGRILGMDITAESTRIRGLVGYMPEITATVPLLKGAEFVTLSGDLYGMPHKDARRRAHEVLNYVGLGELRYRRLDEYSTGNLQRLKLAAALVHDPQLLLLDEPTNGLDPAGRMAMLRTIEDLITETGKSVILCTHLLGDVERICEQLVVLNQGTVILSGTMDQLKSPNTFDYDLSWEGDGRAFVEALRPLVLSVNSSANRATLQSNGQPHANGHKRRERAGNNGSAQNAVQETSANNNGEGATPIDSFENAIRVRVHANWEPRRFFELAQANRITLKRLRPVEENLQDLFLRVTEFLQPGPQSPAL